MIASPGYNYLANYDKRLTIISRENNREFKGAARIKIWKNNGTLLGTIKPKNGLLFPEIKFSSDGKILAICKQALDYSNSRDEIIEIWRVDGTFITNIKNRNYTIYSKFLNLDSKTIAIHNDNNTLELWDIDGKTKAEILPPRTLKVQSNWIEEVKLIPNSNIIAIVGNKDTVKLWDIDPETDKQAKLLQTFQGHSDRIGSTNISPDGKTIASGSWDRTVKLWQRDGTLIYNFQKHTDKVKSVTFSPDGKLIASAGNDKTVKLWKPDGTVVTSFEEHENGINYIDFSPDGKLVASASNDNTLKLWTLDGTVIQTFNHDYPVTGVSFHPNKRIIATATEKGVRLWNLDGKLIKIYQRLGTYNVKFSSDGKSISAPGHLSISPWNFDLDELIVRGCNWADDYLKYNPNVDEKDRDLCD